MLLLRYAPIQATDLTGDGLLELIVATADGSVFAIGSATPYFPTLATHAYGHPGAGTGALQLRMATSRGSQHGTLSMLPFMHDLQGPGRAEGAADDGSSAGWGFGANPWAVAVRWAARAVGQLAGESVVAIRSEFAEQRSTSSHPADQHDGAGQKLSALWSRLFEAQMQLRTGVGMAAFWTITSGRVVHTRSGQVTMSFTIVDYRNFKPQNATHHRNAYSTPHARYRVRVMSGTAVLYSQNLIRTGVFTFDLTLPAPVYMACKLQVTNEHGEVYTDVMSIAYELDWLPLVQYALVVPIGLVALAAFLALIRAQQKQVVGAGSAGVPAALVGGAMGSPMRVESGVHVD